jgi:hypothetical protein
MSIEKAFISFRISPALWMPQQRFDELMTLFEKYKGVTDEITFFTSETHPCLPLAVIQERGQLLSKRMDAVRKLGYRTGINIIATIGHHNENLANSLSGDYTPMTNIDGKICLGSRCPNDPRMQNYVQELYRIITGAKPDYIWIDDDIRFGHMPIGFGCYCDHCLERFARKVGRPFSRAELKFAFNEGSIDQKFEIRKKWLEHNRQTIGDLLSLIEKTVHTISPKMPLGFMSGDRFYEGYDFEHWAKILSGTNGSEVMWRPGGGFYSDETLPGLIEKSHEIGRQVSQLPDSVCCIQSEIENFPYQRLKKAARITALESASHIAAGCTGTAFNVLAMADEPLDEYEPLMAELHKFRPFYDQLVKNSGRLMPRGIYTGWNKDIYAATNLGQGNWHSGDVCKLAGGFAREIYEIGLPPAYRIDNAQVTALTGEAVRSISSKDIEKILSGGVYLDASALMDLNQMGYHDLTGFDVERFYEADCIEQLVEHPLNGRFVHRNRDCRQSFLGWTVPAASLIARDQKSQTLSRLIDYAGNEITSCNSGIYENRLGGRVYVAGYFPWTFLQNYAKACQVKSIFRWLSRDTLDAYIASYHKINLWTRRLDDGQLGIILINTSYDDADGIELKVLSSQKNFTLFSLGTDQTLFTTGNADDQYRSIILPKLAPWSLHMVV